MRSQSWSRSGKESAFLEFWGQSRESESKKVVNPDSELGVGVEKIETRSRSRDSESKKVETWSRSRQSESNRSCDRSRSQESESNRS